MDRLILLQLDDIRLKAVCESNKYATRVCNEVFWRTRVEQKYGAVVANAKSERMTYRNQYFTLQTFVSKAGRLVRSKRVNAAKQGRLDAFIAYKNVWNADGHVFKLFHILIQKGYKDIVKEIILTYGERLIEILKKTSFLFFLLTIKDLAKEDDAELLDLLYKEYLLKTGKPVPIGYIYEILIATTGNKVLKWAIDNDIINNQTVDMYPIFRRNPKDELRIIKFLAEHDIFPSMQDIYDTFMRYKNANISLKTLDFLISKGIITPTKEMVDAAVNYGKLNILELLAKHRILPDSRAANGALRCVYQSTTMPLVKWLHEHGIEPTDKGLIRSILYPPKHTLQYDDALENNKWLKSAFKYLL